MFPEIYIRTSMHEGRKRMYRRSRKRRRRRGRRRKRRRRMR
jgi:hypothetical protein